MLIWNIVLTLLASTLSICLGSDVDILLQDDCLKLGFDSTLKCSTCQLVKEVLDVEIFYSDCLKCCIDDSDGGITKYAKAALISDKHLVSKDLASILKRLKKEGYPLTVLGKTGARPELRFYMVDATEVSESVNVATWNPSAVEEFLKEKLQMKQ